MKQLRYLAITSYVVSEMFEDTQKIQKPKIEGQTIQWSK